MTKENKKVDVLLRYDQGLNRFYGLIELSEDAVIFTKVSTRYEMPDGSKVFGKAILSEPEKYFTTELLDKLNDHAKKVFLYGGFDEENVEAE